MEKLTQAQQTFGNKHDWMVKKMKAVITNPEGTLTLIPFDDQPNKLTLLLTLFPKNVTKVTQTLINMLRNILKEHGDCPDGENFWEWFISIRKGRIATVHQNMIIMFRHIQMTGYYSKTFKQTVYNFRLKQRDGVKKEDVILTEDEVAYIIRKEYNLLVPSQKIKQIALDTFVLAVFSGARYADVKTIVKSTDEAGNPVLMFHNKKSSKSMTVAWNKAVEGALERELYKKPRTSGKVMCSALKAALFEALPSSSNRLISYYYLRPGRGRELRTDNRISHITFHTARHTFCTRLLKIGVGVHIVAQLAGHRTIQTTMKYYNYTKEKEANDVLRQVYGAKAIVTEKPEWGSGAVTKPLPAKVHKAQLPKPQKGKPAPDDGGLLNKYKNSKQNRMTPKQLAWQNKLKAKGLL